MPSSPQSKASEQSKRVRTELRSETELSKSAFQRRQEYAASLEIRSKEQTRAKSNGNLTKARKISKPRVPTTIHNREWAWTRNIEKNGAVAIKTPQQARGTVLQEKRKKWVEKTQKGNWTGKPLLNAAVGVRQTWRFGALGEQEWKKRDSVVRKGRTEYAYKVRKQSQSGQKKIVDSINGASARNGHLEAERKANRKKLMAIRKKTASKSHFALSVIVGNDSRQSLPINSSTVKTDDKLDSLLIMTRAENDICHNESHLDRNVVEFKELDGPIERLTGVGLHGSASEDNTVSYKRNNTVASAPRRSEDYVTDTVMKDTFADETLDFESLTQPKVFTCSAAERLPGDTMEQLSVTSHEIIRNVHAPRQINMYAKRRTMTRSVLGIPNRTRQNRGQAVQIDVRQLLKDVQPSYSHLSLLSGQKKTMNQNISCQRLVNKNILADPSIYRSNGMGKRSVTQNVFTPWETHEKQVFQKTL